MVSKPLHTLRRYRIVAALCAGLALPTAAMADFDAGQEAYDARDYPAAHQHWREAALAGDAKAQYQLGLMLANGTGVQKDVISAYVWLMLADQAGIRAAKQHHQKLQRDHIPRHCHYEALKLVRDFQTGTTGSLAAGQRQGSRCWDFNAPNMD